MICTVHHNQTPGHRFELDPASWHQGYGKFTTVAVVEAEGRYPQDILEAVFDATNSHQGIWTKHNAGILALPNGIEQRSTSVGDVIVLGDAVYMVATLGFDDITRAT